MPLFNTNQIPTVGIQIYKLRQLEFGLYMSFANTKIITMITSFRVNKMSLARSDVLILKEICRSTDQLAVSCFGFVHHSVAV